MPNISQIDEVPCQAEVRISQKITLNCQVRKVKYTQVRREFYVPKNSFHMLPRVLKAYLKA